MASVAADTSNTTMHAAKTGTHRASAGTPTGLSGPGLELKPANGPGMNADAAATSTIPDTAARTPHRPAERAPVGEHQRDQRQQRGTQGPQHSLRPARPARRGRRGVALGPAAGGTGNGAGRSGGQQQPSDRVTRQPGRQRRPHGRRHDQDDGVHGGVPPRLARRERLRAQAADPTPATRSHSKPAKTAYRRPAAPAAQGTVCSSAAISIPH